MGEDGEKLSAYIEDKKALFKDALPNFKFVCAGGIRICRRVWLCFNQAMADPLGYLCRLRTLANQRGD